MVEEGQSQVCVAPEQLEAAAGVGGGVAQHPPADGVGDPRGQALGGAVAALAAHAGDHPKLGRRAVVPRFEQRRNIGGIVLAVAVEGGDPGGARAHDPGPERRALTRLVAVAQHPEPGIAGLQVGKLGAAAIAATVVDIDDLEVNLVGQGGIDL